MALNFDHEDAGHDYTLLQGRCAIFVFLLLREVKKGKWRRATLLLAGSALPNPQDGGEPSEK